MADTTELKSNIMVHQRYIEQAKAQKMSGDLITTLEEELALLTAKLQEAEGTLESSDLTGEAAAYQIRRALATRTESQAKLNAKLAIRQSEQEFKQSINPSYDWDTDPLKEDEVKLINKYRQEVSTASDILVKLQGVVTHRIGFEIDEAIDSVISPSGQFVRGAASTFEVLADSDDEMVGPFSADFGEDDDPVIAVAAYLKKASAERAYALLKPIFELAAAQAGRNHAASRRYLEETRATEMDKIWNQVNRRVKMLARKVGIVTQNDSVPSLKELRQAVMDNPEYVIDVITFDIDAWKRQAGGDWDESVLETINFLVDANAVKIVAKPRIQHHDIQAMESILKEMQAPLSASRFIDHHDRDIAAAAAEGGPVWAEFREQYRNKVNSLKNDRARKNSAPMRR